MWGRRWLAALQPHDADPVERALDAVHATPPGQPVSAEAARTGLAASEVVAASLGAPAEGLPPPARTLAARCAPRLRALRERARAVVERIHRNPPSSSPSDLWDEPDAATEQAEADARDWRTEMDLLARRLAD